MIKQIYPNLQIDHCLPLCALCMYRVFNWDGRKGGAGMEDLPSLISSAIEATLNNTEAMRVYAAEKADKLG